jgi:hypothetical protein
VVGVTRRARLAVGAVALALVAVVAVALLALPAVVRLVALRQIEAMTGQPASIADVDVNVFSRRLGVIGFRLDGAGGRPPLLELEQLRAEFRLLPLLRGRLSFEAVTLDTPTLRIVRTEAGEIDVAQVIARVLGGPPREEPLDLTLERLALRNGTVVFEDRAVLTGTRAWALSHLSIEAHDLVTAADATSGTAEARFRLAGAPVTITATKVGLRPVRGQATVLVDGLDLAAGAVYVAARTPLRLERGQLSARIDLVADGEGLRAGARASLSDVELRRPAPPGLVAVIPAATVLASDVRYDSGAARAGRLEVVTAVRITDLSGDAPRHYAVSPLALLVEDAGGPAGTPAEITLAAGLPAGGRLDAHGTATLSPPAVDIGLVLGALDLGLVTSYVPPAAPVRVEDGQLAAALRLTYAPEAGLGLSGRTLVTGARLFRRGQSEPFIVHERLESRIAGLTLRDGHLAAERVVLSGAPTIIDASVEPPQRFDVTAASVTVEDLTWPGAGAARVQGRARVGSSIVTLRGMLHPATLVTEATVSLSDVELDRFAGYLPADAPVTLAGGRADAAVRLGHDRAGVTRLDAHATVRDLELTAGRGETPVVVSDRRLVVLVDGLTVAGGALTGGSLTVTGSPTLDAPGRTSASLDIPGLLVKLESLRWPPRGALPVQVGLRLPDAGTVEARGRLGLAARRLDLEVQVRDAGLAPYSGLLPIDATVQGRLDASLEVDGQFARGPELDVAGDVRVSQIALGEGERPPVVADRVEITGLEARWPAIHIERVLVARPSALIERAKDGSFPLRAMLDPPDPGAAGAAPANPPDDGPRRSDDRERPVVQVTIEELVVQDGDVRFVDRTTTPFYSEDITDLALTLRGLTNQPGDPAEIRVQGIVGVNATLDVRGQISPLGEPLSVELAGELQDFAVARTNPYLRRFLDWVARRGELSTEVRYQIEGDQLEAINEIVVRDLAVSRAPGGDGRGIGLPLGLVVSLLKNSRGEIRLTVPVEGKLSSPQFSFGDAIATALRNVLTKLVTGPFRAIGRVFRGSDGTPETLEVDPVTFEPGDASLDREAAKQLQRIADFLRASPYVRVGLQAVISDQDLEALRKRAVTARLQGLQRAEKLPGLAAAAAREFHTTFPGRPTPDTTAAIVQALAEREPVPGEAAGELASRRLETTRQMLTRSAGVEDERLADHASPRIGGREGRGRVEFELQG